MNPVLCKISLGFVSMKSSFARGVCSQVKCGGEWPCGYWLYNRLDWDTLPRPNPFSSTLTFCVHVHGLTPSSQVPTLKRFWSTFYLVGIVKVIVRVSQQVSYNCVKVYEAAGLTGGSTTGQWLIIKPHGMVLGNMRLGFFFKESKMHLRWKKDRLIVG